MTNLKNPAYFLDTVIIFATTKTTIKEIRLERVVYKVFSRYESTEATKSRRLMAANEPTLSVWGFFNAFLSLSWRYFLIFIHCNYFKMFSKPVFDTQLLTLSILYPVISPSVKSLGLFL